MKNKALYFYMLIILCSGFYFLGTHSVNKTPTELSNLTGTHSLDLPLKYFADSDVVFGSGTTEDKNDWVSATMKDGYQSFPTTTITLSTKDYSQEIKALPSIKSFDELSKEDPGAWDNYQGLYKEQIKEYGDTASRFLMGDYITKLEKFDVDLDGKDETIISTCGTGGNHCPHKIIIIKDNKIIFSVSAGLVDLAINKSETGNGFYVHWVPTDQGPKWNSVLCCPSGYIKTRFVYENGKFIPVYEQEVLYFTIRNTPEI